MVIHEIGKGFFQRTMGFTRKFVRIEIVELEIIYKFYLVNFLLRFTTFELFPQNVILVPKLKKIF